MNQLAKAHAFCFYVLRITFRTVSRDGLEDWKALVVLSVAMEFTLLMIVTIVSIYLEHPVLLPASKGSFLTMWGLIGAGLVLLNQVTLVAGRKWRRFEREFQNYSKAMRVGSGIALWFTVILLCLATFWTGSMAGKLPQN